MSYSHAAVTIQPQGAKLSPGQSEVGCFFGTCLLVCSVSYKSYI